MSTIRDLREIDRIVDQVLDDREKAEKLKEILHRDLGGDAAKALESKESSEEASLEEEDADEELWDNVPI